MDFETANRVIHQAADAWMNGRADAFVELFRSDGVFVFPGQSLIGPEAIRQAFAEFYGEHHSVQIEIQNIVLSGDCAAVEWIWQDTESTSGKRTIAEDAILIDFVKGGIQRWREYIDASPQV